MKVSKEEMNEFMHSRETVNYLPHLPAFNPKSNTTPVCVVFDASRQQEGGPSLNQLLAKGPDRYLNNLATVITMFRAGRFVALGDIKKMFNAVELAYRDTFLQCFLWRGMDDSKEPEALCGCLKRFLSRRLLSRLFGQVRFLSRL